MKKEVKVKKIFSLACLLLFMVFIVFIFFNEYQAKKNASHQVEKHAQVISDNLWEINKTGIKKYLELAIRTLSYKTITVRDGKKKIFIKVTNQEISSPDSLLIKLHLIGFSHIKKNILYNNINIGTIEVIYYSTTIYTYFYLLIICVLILLILYMYLALLRNNYKLDYRVQQRTHELNISNRELSTSKKSVTNIINSMPSVIIGVDFDQKITHWNLSAEKNYGIDFESAVGKDIVEFFPEHTDEYQMILESIKSKEVKRKKRTISGKNNIRYERLIIYPFGENTVDGVVIRIDNITKEQQLELKIFQSSKMETLGQLTGGVAHDFNNILAGMINGLQLIKRDESLTDRSKKYVRMLLKEAKRAADLIARMLAFSRKTKNVFEAHYINDIIDDVVNILESSIDKKIRLLSHYDCRDLRSAFCFLP